MLEAVGDETEEPRGEDDARNKDSEESKRKRYSDEKALVN